jgi:UDP:flavonoid glycosyltransferase YjiC (YdhE family)
MRILFASTRHAGHIGPLIPLARAAMRAGHEVVVATAGTSVPSDVPHHPVAGPSPEAVASVWKPVWPPAPVPAAHVVSALFFDLHARTALPDMLALVAEWEPDVIVRETMEFSSALAAADYDVPQIRFGIHLDAENDARVHELAPLPDPVAEAIEASPLLSLAPRSFGGPDDVLRFHEPAPPRSPEWDPPLVYVSFGSETPASDLFPRIYRNAIDALAELPVRVLVTTGRDPGELGPVPPSVHVARWVPQPVVMRHAAVMVGHGGSGSTLMALAAGVPQALVPLFVDGPANAARIAELGAGIALEGGPEADIGGAVRELLEMPRYSWAAGVVAAEIQGLPPIDDAVELLVQRSAAGHAIR